MIPIYLNDEHRRNHDYLIEGLWRARTWMRQNGKQRIETMVTIPEFLQRRRKRA